MSGPTPTPGVACLHGTSGICGYCDGRPKAVELPRPDCPCGFTRPQVEQIMGDRIEAFDQWMTGQTRMICSGKGCPEAHGVCTYGCDIRAFLDGRQPLD